MLRDEQSIINRPQAWDNDPDMRAFTGLNGTLNTAILLARKGKYGEAQERLQQVLDAGECSEAEALDLQARIYAQQGNYLPAESCWRQAQALDELNPAYARSLNRLQRGRVSHDRFFYISTLLVLIVAVGMLLWQIVYLHPSTVYHLKMNENFLAAIQGDLGLLHRTHYSTNEKVVNGIKGVNRQHGDLGSSIEEQLGGLATTEQMSQDRVQAVNHLDNRVALLQKAAQEQLIALGAFRSETENVRDKRFIELGVMVSALKETTLQIERRLIQTINASATHTVQSLDVMRASTKQDLKSLSTSRDMAAVSQAITGLQESLVRIEVIMEEAKATSIVDVPIVPEVTAVKEIRHKSDQSESEQN